MKTVKNFNSVSLEITLYAESRPSQPSNTYCVCNYIH